MKDKARLIDIAKNITIVLLSVSAILLLLKITINGPDSLFGSLEGIFSSSSGTGAVNLPDSESSGLTADPVYILITAENGSHYAVKYDSKSKDKLNSQFSAYLGEALGTSGKPTEISSETWREALSGSGVFFDYLYPQPLSAIASWLGFEMSGEASDKVARRFFLGSDDGRVFLCFLSEDDGRIYRCSTSMSFSSLEPKIAGCPIGSANFAFELGEAYAKLDPYFIFSHESCSLREVTVSDPVREGFDNVALLGYFGMNSRVASEYQENNGSVAYVDGDKSLRIESSGKVVFSTTGDSGLYLNSSSSGLSAEDCISACYEIVKNSIGLTSGDSAIGLVGITDASSPSSCTVSFGYFVDGIPVILPEGVYAATFQISGGAIVKAELYFRKYTFSGSTINAPPETQAAAIAQSTGGEPVLTYEDKTVSVGCTWINNKD